MLRSIKACGIEPPLEMSSEARFRVRAETPSEWRRPRGPSSVHGESTRRQEAYPAAFCVQ